MILVESLVTKEQFVDLYINQNKSQAEMGEILGVKPHQINEYARKFNIKKPRALVTAKRNATNQIRYGGNSSLCNPEVYKKARRTMKEKYGVEFSGQNAELLNKMHDTIEKKTGVRYATQKGKDIETIKILTSKERLKEFINHALDKTLEGIAKALGYDATSVSIYLKRFGLEDLCDPYYFTSSKEKEVEEFLLSHGVEVKKNKKIIYPKEIDLYNESTHTGVEFNGCFYHNVQKKGVFYHQEKSLLGDQKGVFIYHLYEYEWVNEKLRPWIENDLLNVFNLLPSPEGRICYSLISIREAENFVKENGYFSEPVRGELFFKGEINNQKIVIFSILAFQGKITVLNICVRKGVSKQPIKRDLLKSLCKSSFIQEIEYTSDLNKERDDFLQQLNFECVEILPPQEMFCTYYKGEFAFKNNLTQEEIENYSRQSIFETVYDAGKKKWRWRRSNAESTKSLSDI